MSLYVQYGCGLSAPDGWKNFDASPTLRLQKIPLIGILARKKTNFPRAVLYGDIIKGLPGIGAGSCDAVYCSHVLEHLSLKDFYTALMNSYSILKQGGVFRCVLPDLEWAVQQYLSEKQNNVAEASIHFMQNTLLGTEERPGSIKDKVIDMFGNSNHLWMWDKDSLHQAFVNAGFASVRKCTYGDAADKHFLLVEDKDRFNGAVAFECIK
jgi:SAM-dependent methyltransferase